MIVPETTPATPPKGAPVPLPRSGESSQFLPPPAYQPGGQSQYDYNNVYLPYVRPQPVYRQSPLRRFLAAFAVAVGIWFLFTILIRSIVELSSHHPGRWYQLGYDFPEIPSGIALDKCISSEDWGLSQRTIEMAAPDAQSSIPSFPYSVATSFDLPISSDTLFLLARGTMSGTMDIKTSPDVSDVARVDITLQYVREDALQNAKACLISRKRGENGVGVFAVHRWGSIPWRDRLHFTVSVTLPESSDSALLLNNFETDLPNFTQTVAEMDEKVDFRSLSLKGSNGFIVTQTLNVVDAIFRTSNAAITIKSLSAESASLRSSNGPIRGTFNTSGPLDLVTSNNVIKVDVNLHAEDQDTIHNLVMRTSNGPIQADVTLVSATETGGKFGISARTSNNVLNVKVPTAPVDVVLNVDGTTSNGRADLSVPPAFEGSFVLSTSNAVPTVQETGADDPSGKDRKRSIRTSTVRRGHSSGWVYWSKDNNERGSIVLRSSNNPITLVV